jgi:hypothetical protein
MLENRLSADDLKQPAPKPRGIKLEVIADPQKRARVVIIGNEPKAGEVSNAGVAALLASPNEMPPWLTKTLSSTFAD